MESTNDLFSSLGLMFKVIPFVVGLVPLIIVFVVIRHVRSFKTNVFQNIGSDVLQRIDRLPKPNRSYVKTKCDHCGAKCTGSRDISPSGDLKCSYCGTWFNVFNKE